MLAKISLVIALCANLSTSQIQSKVKELEAQHPNSKVSVRIDRKASCDASGTVLRKRAQ